MLLMGRDGRPRQRRRELRCPEAELLRRVMVSAGSSRDGASNRESRASPWPSPRTGGGQTEHMGSRMRRTKEHCGLSRES
jgi:hypothetical protein